MEKTQPSADATSQERLWAGSFGSEYMERNRDAGLVESNQALFQKVLERTGPIESVIEFGANIGNNLRALRELLPSGELHAIEINESAAAEIRRWGGATVEVASAHRVQLSRTWDLTFTKGVLIHISPDELPAVYDNLYAASNRFIMVCEYYNPTPVEVPYRGHTGALFKRDFAGELLDRFSDLELVDYGFTYHRDPQHPLDDSTWFLMKKASA